ncbi:MULTISPECIES: Rrf2 family transcriptional regulator [unclassified Fusibacter]|uniref:RrF2 family transcriptional regulator n=1 Tax=unclassified Fusibacter TaxID=2624464 RepID=UPI00101370E3|nr:MULTISPECIES: Rrf2 family transcriptional regulator [unclassified Fusibacter]MCK8060968.1 Rrf2 family transcriptional regulator [Fusibacter sp. A2]NPE23264.1 Rrf2 family transcriptional regulator [Fusibacter sp. A1]RXV59617.1 Rrf2 family transcriptional regulator [Fusibacter sp. A1]
MKVSSKARYGLKALLDLAVHAKVEHVALKSIAERQNISDRYLEQVFSLMKKSGFVKSVKGPQGGYSLACDPKTTSAYDIIMALEGEEVFRENYDKKDAAESVINQMVWQPLDIQVEETLKAITLESMVRSYEETLTPSEYMFFI